MTATWSVDIQTFYNNVKHVQHNNSIMAVVKNNAYHYGLELLYNSFKKLVLLL